MTAHQDDPQDSPLYMWTVYDHPRDFPDTYVARKFAVEVSGAHPTSEVFVSEDVDNLRVIFKKMGLVCLARDVGDDAKIMEIWL